MIWVELQGCNHGHLCIVGVGPDDMKYFFLKGHQHMESLLITTPADVIIVIILDG